MYRSDTEPVLRGPAFSLWTESVYTDFNIAYNLDMEFPNSNDSSPILESQILKPNGSNMFLRSILFVLVVLVVGFGGFVIYTKYKNAPVKLSGLEVALKTVSFIDKTLQPDGGMSAGFGCPPGSLTCDSLKIDENQPHLGQAIYGYYSLAKASGDQSFRTKSDLAINFVLDKCKTNVQMCAWNYFPLSRYYFDTKEEKYLAGMLKPAQGFLDMSHENIIAQNAGHKLASLYLATGDDKYKVRLLEIADKELSNWPNKSAYSIQVVWSVFVPAYNITKDKKYLTASEQFFDNYNLADNIDKIEPIQTILKGADALLGLADISEKGTEYRVQAHEVLQKVLDKFWDNPENLKVNGDYGFLEILPKDKHIRFKMTINNGWLVKLFTILAKEKFVLPIKNAQN